MHVYKPEEEDPSRILAEIYTSMRNTTSDGINHMSLFFVCEQVSDRAVVDQFLKIYQEGERIRNIFFTDVD